MRNLIITKSDSKYKHLHLPYVIFDKEEGIFKLYGYSLEEKESVDLYFKDIYEWIDDYVKDPNASSDFYFGFHYVNEYSLICIANLTEKIKNLPNLNVYWVYHPDDEDMEEILESFSKSVNVKIIPKTDSIYDSILYKG